MSNIVRVEDDEIRPPGGAWHRAKRCASGNCVEVRIGSEFVGVRDSKDLANDLQAAFPSIEVPANRWPLFLSEVAGELEAGTNGAILFDEQVDGQVVLASTESHVELTYNSDEWTAFKLGVTEGDFGPLHQPV